MAVVVLGLVIVPAPGHAAITNSDFPSKATVKSVMGGKGGWRAFAGDIATLGAKPGRCRSDKQLLNFDDVRAKSYHGQEKGRPRSVFSGAELVVLRYGTVDEARRAVRRSGTYPARCPEVVEWVCEECDGISTTWRTKVTSARVGAQSVIWKFRRVDNFKSNGYAVVAREGSTVVRVIVSRTRDVTGPNGWVYPQLVNKRVVVKMARVALRRAA